MEEVTPSQYLTLVGAVVLAATGALAFAGRVSVQPVLVGVGLLAFGTGSFFVGRWSSDEVRIGSPERQ